MTFPISLIEQFRELHRAARLMSFNDAQKFQAKMNGGTFVRLCRELQALVHVTGPGGVYLAIARRGGPTGILFENVHLWVDGRFGDGDLHFEPADTVAPAVLSEDIDS